MRYVITKFSIEDELLQHANVANPKKRMEVSFKSVAYFVKRFKLLWTLTWNGICTLPPTGPTQRCSGETRGWSMAGHRKITNEFTTGGELTCSYQILPKVMLMILSILHSNAEDERVFSMVRQNATDFRASLKTTYPVWLFDPESLLCSSRNELLWNEV